MSLERRKNEERGEGSARGERRKFGIRNLSMDNAGRADQESRCGICKFVTKDGEDALCCELWDTWYHVGCHKEHYKCKKIRSIYGYAVCKPV